MLTADCQRADQGLRRTSRTGHSAVEFWADRIGWRPCTSSNSGTAPYATRSQNLIGSLGRVERVRHVELCLVVADLRRTDVGLSELWRDSKCARSAKWSGGALLYGDMGICAVPDISSVWVNFVVAAIAAIYRGPCRRAAS